MKDQFNNSFLWKPNDLDGNLMQLRYLENFLNEKLRANGYVTVFDIYNALGLRLDINRILNCESIRELLWMYDEDGLLNFLVKTDEENDIIDIDFNINID